MSSDFKNNFCFVTEEIFELEVSESALKLKQMEKNLGTIRGRQATVDALIGNERYPTIRRLRTHSDWLRKVSGPIRRLGPHERESKRVKDSGCFPLCQTDRSEISGNT